MKYWTKSPGTGGTLLVPEDFIVREITNPKYLRKYSRNMEHITGRYGIFLMYKKGMTTQDAITRIAHILKIRKDCIGYAGLKDKFAVTEQYITLPARFDKKDFGQVQLTKIGTCNNKIFIGDLKENRFEITLHGCKTNKIHEVVHELHKRGIPNFFGPQRFGKHENNHIIGKLIIKRQFQKALKIINANHNKRFYSLHNVPKRMLKFFINAYQSWIFNEILITYIKNHKTPSYRNASIIGYNENDKDTLYIMKKQGITPQSFKINDLRITCSGSKRPLFIKTKIVYKIINDKIKLFFTIPKGSYATVVLNEITKVRYQDRIQ